MRVRYGLRACPDNMGLRVTAMTECEFLHRCLLHQQLSGKVPAMARDFETTYCRKNYFLCARHRVAIVGGLDKVPMSLLPTDVDEAAWILERIQRQFAQ